MSSIYGYTELTYALADASERQLSIRMAEELLHRSWEMAGWDGVTQTAAEYGVTAVVDKLGNPVFYTRAAIEGATETAAELTYSTATEAAIDSVTNEVVVKEVAQVATQGATKTLLRGGLTTAVKALPIIGAIATGAGLGWESYKAHPEAWTDLSESIFNYDASPNTPLEVLARIHAGGYTTAVKEENMAKIIQGMAAAGCFDYQAVGSDVEEAGVQPIHLSAINPHGETGARAAALLAELYPSDTIVQIVEYDDTDYTYTRVCGVNMSDVPSVGNIILDTTSYTLDTYVCRDITIHMVGCTYNKNNDTFDTESEGSANGVVSGVTYTVGKLYKATGGLNVNIVEHTGNNLIFVNEHVPGGLSLPQTATLSDSKEAIKTQYPNWYENSWIQPEYNPETGQIENKRYYPITVPWWDYENESKDPSYDQNEAQSGDIKPETDPESEEQAEEITKADPVDIIDTPIEPIVPPVPTPPYVPIDDNTGLGLWAVYNPTLSELNDLGAYLWSSNIIDILQKFLQNPMDAIISLHKIFATPTTGNKENIILGYLDSGVQANKVIKQFIEINCGSVTVPEYFSDARDYDVPYTEVECYLPFIGIVRLKTADIIGGKVNIRYSIDTYSGACLCKIYVTKLGAKQLLYNFSSNCSMQIPLTGSDRTRLLSGAVAGAVAGAAVGGPVGAVAGAVGGAWKGGTSIERTSGFSANAGCMGVKKPYLIITRKYAYDAGNYNHFYGYPSNNTVTLSSCKGFTRVKSAHIENIGRATNNEKAEIETLLKQGVIIK